MDVKQNYQLLDVINSLDLRIQDSGYAILDAQWNKQHVCEYHSKIYLVKSGEGLLYTDTQQIVMKSGHVYLIPYGCRHSRQCRDTMTKLYFHVELNANGSDLLSGYERILEIPLPKDKLEHLLQLFPGFSFADALSIQQYLYTLLNAFDTQFHITSRRGVYRSELVQETIMYIQHNLSAVLQVNDLAQRRFVSKTYLERCFREEVGLSVGRYIDEQLMRTARWWLSQTSHSVTAISQLLGYPDPCYFSRRFRQLMGITPLAYRKSSHH